MTDSNSASALRLLDHVVWSALTTCQADLAISNDSARCYRPEFAPFAALRTQSVDSYRQLAWLIDASDQVFDRLALITRQPIPEQPWFEVHIAKSMDQMIGPDTQIELRGEPPVDLAEEDLKDMTELIEITKPGPFRRSTHRLGRFVGIRDKQRLLAMSGERMHLTGFTEVSAVCAHPDGRGRGLAYQTVAAITNGILARGETPILHVFSDNHFAIALYQKLGYRRRSQFILTNLSRNKASMAG
jgi:predicted GNAT family acetyltransferase